MVFDAHLDSFFFLLFFWGGTRIERCWRLSDLL